MAYDKAFSFFFILLVVDVFISEKVVAREAAYKSGLVADVSHLGQGKHKPVEAVVAKSYPKDDTSKYEAKKSSQDGGKLGHEAASSKKTATNKNADAKYPGDGYGGYPDDGYPGPGYGAYPGYPGDSVPGSGYVAGPYDGYPGGGYPGGGYPGGGYPGGRGGYGGPGGYPGGRGGYGGPGGPGGGYGGGYPGRAYGYCRFGCCGSDYYGGCRCCSYPGEAADRSVENRPLN